MFCVDYHGIRKIGVITIINRLSVYFEDPTEKCAAVQRLEPADMDASSFTFRWKVL